MRNLARDWNGATIGIAILLASGASGCGTDAADPEGDVPASGSATLLAEVETGDATVRFFDADGGFLVTSLYPLGTPAPELGEGEHVSVIEQFQRIAPGVPVPEALA